MFTSNLTTDWKQIIENITITNKEKTSKLKEFIEKEYSEKKIYPKKDDIFRAFNYFNFNELKIVVLGQDPYHQSGQAHGLSFSVNKDIKIPPSLKNIYKEIASDLELELDLTDNIFNHGFLEEWAKQGILLLNTSLTVVESKPNSHSKWWRPITNQIIKHIVENNENIIFMLWGNNAKKIKKLFSEQILKRHYFLEATHPSPLGANKGGWFGSKHFSKSNEILENLNKDKINWTIN